MTTIEKNKLKIQKSSFKKKLKKKNGQKWTWWAPIQVLTMPNVALPW